MECTTVRESMLDVLYGESAGETARRVEEHIGVCAGCREELAAFRRVRGELRSYALPPLQAPRAQHRGRLPAALAAAAALGLALGGALVQARLDDLERRLQDQQTSHARELARLRGALVATPASTDSALVERVRQMLRESEERQGQRLAASLRDLSQRSEAQRRYDLARVSAGLSYLDGRSGQHAARTTQLMGYLLQAAERR